jgi:hypothetical protein
VPDVCGRFRHPLPVELSPLVCCVKRIRIHKSIILPVVLYERETWSHILKDEHRLRVFENTVLRGIFGPKRGEVTVGWRKLRIEGLDLVQSSSRALRDWQCI